MVVIVDCDIGNIGSIVKIINKIGYQVIFSGDVQSIQEASHLILPGVGSFDYMMEKLNEKQLIPVLFDKVINKNTPILGICLGMHVLMGKSEEGVSKGLGWLKGEVRKFKLTNNIKIPHMGWNDVNPKRNCRLFKGLDKPRFYFVHSYYVLCEKYEDICAETNYGCIFTSAVARENIYGVQFHPEKSHKYGMQLLKNFIEL